MVHLSETQSAIKSFSLQVYFPLFMFISLMAHNPNRSETYRYGSSQWGHGYNVRPYNALTACPRDLGFHFSSAYRAGQQRQRDAGTNYRCIGPHIQRNYEL